MFSNQTCEDMRRVNLKELPKGHAPSLKEKNIKLFKLRLMPF